MARRRLRRRPVSPPTAPFPSAGPHDSPARQLPSQHVQAVFTLLARWPPLPSSRKRSGPPPASLALQSCKNLGCPMPVIPIPRRVRSFHGPHTTCLHSACGPVRTAPLVRTKYNNFDIYLKSRWMYGVIRFLLYFSCSLFTSVLWVALAVLFCIQYLGIRFFLRFQYKLSITLLLMGRRRVDFSLVNELLIYAIHVTMLLVGGLGWCFMVFVDM